MFQPDEIARLCHEVNRAYCQSLGDDSHLPWEHAPEWQRDSAIRGVQRIMIGDPLDPAALHNSWLMEKLKAGWVYGPVKNAELKEHPCCLPYEQLPPHEKAKDYLFGAIVETIRAIQGERLGDGVAGDRMP